MTKATAALVVEIREVRPQPYLGKRLRVPMGSVGSRVREGFGALYQRLSATHTPDAGPPFLIAEQPRDGYLDVELGAPCAAPPPAGDGFEAGILPGGREAVTVHRGTYEGLGDVYGQLHEWIAAHDLAITGPPREVYLTPPGQTPVTEIAWPIA